MKKCFIFSILLVVSCLLLVISGCSRPNGAMLSQEDLIRNESNSSLLDFYIYNESSLEVTITSINWKSDFYSQPYFLGGAAGVYTKTLQPGEGATLEVSLSPAFRKSHAMDFLYTFHGQINGGTYTITVDQRITDVNGNPNKDLSDGFTAQTSVGTQEYFTVVSPCKYQSSQTFDRETTAEEMTRKIGLDPSKIPGKWVKDVFKAALTKYSNMLWMVQYNYNITLTDYMVTN